VSALSWIVIAVRVARACPPKAAQVMASAGNPSDPVGSNGPKIRTIGVEFGGFILKRQAIIKHRVVGFGKIDPIV
jgi:hypothetical protein